MASENAEAIRAIDKGIASATLERDKIPVALAPVDRAGTDRPILIRGNPDNIGPLATRGFPEFLSAIPAATPASAESGRRELAEWLTHPDNMLTPRVIVNRVWGWHFGVGLVGSVDNFGRRGEEPTNLELLDWLSIWFVENGWSVKKLHRLICRSAAYRQRSLAAPAADPERRLLSSWPRRRLEVESIRDAMLAVGGNLDLAVGGSVMTVMNRTYATGGNTSADIIQQMHYDSPRRSVYLPVVRNAVFDMFAIFDYPEPGTVTGQRSVTRVPTQALFLMNSPFVRQQANHFANRLLALAPGEGDRIGLAFELAFSRLPTIDERREARTFIHRESAATSSQEAWISFCHALISSNDFLDLR